MYTINSADIDTVRVLISNMYGCADTAYQVIISENVPVANFEIVNADNIFLGDSTYFKNLSIDTDEYEWGFHDGAISYDFEPEKYYPEPGTYRIRLMATTSIARCADTVYRNLKIKVTSEIFVPNEFSANGDIHNETFSVVLYNIMALEKLIFDHWGKIIFQSTDLNFKWDGTYKGVPVQEDVYAYYIRARGFNNELIVKKGNISVIR